jgi:uncharacterized protein (TIGR02231 family)
MKLSRFVPCAGLASLAFASASFASEGAVVLPADSRISAVTVYSDRAVVSRTASLTLTSAGMVEVVYDRLPESLVEESITVAGHGEANVTILDLVGRTEHVGVTSNERVKSAEDALKKLKSERRALDDRAHVLKAQEASLAKLENAATTAPAKDSAPRLTIEESMKLLSFLEEQRTKLSVERQTLDAQIEALAIRQGAAEQNLAALRGGSGRVQHSIVVRLQVATPGRLDLVLGYALPNAYWSPNYDVRVNSADRVVALGYFGVVQQNTGEDWKEVALTLSTARPSLGGAAPQLGAWNVDVLRPAPPVAAAPRARAQTTFGGAAAADSTEAVKLEAFEVRTAKASVETGATSASFRIATPATVLSDNAPQKVPITSARLTAVPEYATVPKKLAAAFLSAKVQNASEFPLLSGKMNVFLDGTFVAASSLRTVMPGENFELELGADEGISVKYKRVKRFAEDTGLTNSGKRVTYEYLITIQNNKRTTERIVVRDQVPVSRHEKIVVKPILPPERETKPASDGELKWTLDLKPGEKRELPVKFSIDHPNEIVVAGLEP